MAIVQPHPNYPHFRRKLGVMPDFSGAEFSDQEEVYGEQDGKNRVFTILYQPIENSLVVIKDGMTMAKGLDYEYNRDKKQIIFSEYQVPQEKSVIRVSYKHYRMG